MQLIEGGAAAEPVSPLPSRGTVVLDARGSDRSLRLSWHPEEGVVVLSVWRADRCAATFRLATAHVPAVIDALVRGLAASPSTDRGPSGGAFPPVRAAQVNSG